jgi:hypothetical protein
MSRSSTPFSIDERNGTVLGALRWEAWKLSDWADDVCMDIGGIKSR